MRYVTRSHSPASTATCTAVLPCASRPSYPLPDYRAVATCARRLVRPRGHSQLRDWSSASDRTDSIGRFRPWLMMAGGLTWRSASSTSMSVFSRRYLTTSHSPARAANSPTPAPDGSCTATSAPLEARYCTRLHCPSFAATSSGGRDPTPSSSTSACAFSTSIRTCGTGMIGSTGHKLEGGGGVYVGKENGVCAKMSPKGPVFLGFWMRPIWVCVCVSVCLCV
eukprot:5677231-Pyramimonas_sp.AAC.2